MKRLAIISGISAVLFVALACLVVFGVIEGTDRSFLMWLYTYADLRWDSFFLFVTRLGGVLAVGSVTIARASLLYMMGKKRAGLVVIFGLGGAVVLNVLLKLLFERPRPDLWEQLVIETSLSFPSGHAMASLAFALIVGFFVVKSSMKLWLKYVCAGVLAAYVILVGLSRLYLGVHYPSDVIGGWLAAITWVTFILAITVRWAHEKKISIKSDI